MFRPMFRPIAIQFLALVLLLVPAAQAQEGTDPEQLVLDVSRDVLEAVNRNRPTYDTNPDALQAELLALLNPVIDFDSFSRGVMGEFYDMANAAQRAEFQTAFKATLVDLYTSALVASVITDMSLRETVRASDTSANVIVSVATQDGSSYVVQYSMRQDASGSWKARNIILDGVNIGLTYRNQFKSAMETENGDLARVIRIWPELIDGA